MDLAIWRKPSNVVMHLKGGTHTFTNDEFEILAQATWKIMNGDKEFIHPHYAHLQNQWANLREANKPKPIPQRILEKLGLSKPTSNFQRRV